MILPVELVPLSGAVEEVNLDEFADQVLDCEMALLDVLSGFVRHGDGGLAEGEHAARLPHEANASHPDFFRLFDGEDDVLRIAAGTDGKEHIFRRTEGLDLSSKDPVIVVVIRVGGDKRGVRRECERG